VLEFEKTIFHLRKINYSPSFAEIVLVVRKQEAGSVRWPSETDDCPTG